VVQFLFEDNAEFGFGYRLAFDKHAEQAQELLTGLGSALGSSLVDALLAADQSTEAGIAGQRERVAALLEKLKGLDGLEARRLERLAEYLVRKSVWIVGGTAGPTTSGTAASITCWRWDAT